MKKQILNLLKRSPVGRAYSFFQRKKESGLRITKTIIGSDNEILIDPSSEFSGCSIQITGNSNKVIVKKSVCCLNVTIYISGNFNVISICENVRFNRGGSLWIEDHNCEIRVEKNTTFEDVHIAATESDSKILIGEDCMFANDIGIRTGDSHSIIDSATGKRINFAKDIEIEDHVWVASHVSILKGVKIAKNSVVATRSVVTKQFETAGILVAGAPAKVVKSNINWDRRRLES